MKSAFNMHLHSQPVMSSTQPVMSSTTHISNNNLWMLADVAADFLKRNQNHQDWTFKEEAAAQPIVSVAAKTTPTTTSAPSPPSLRNHCSSESLTLTGPDEKFLQIFSTPWWQPQSASGVVNQSAYSSSCLRSTALANIPRVDTFKRVATWLSDVAEQRASTSTCLAIENPPPRPVLRLHCPKCHLVFSSQQSRISHYSVVHLKEMYMCSRPGCNKLFAYYGSKRVHEKNAKLSIHRGGSLVKTGLFRVLNSPRESLAKTELKQFDDYCAAANFKCCCCFGGALGDPAARINARLHADSLAASPRIFSCFNN